MRTARTVRRALGAVSIAVGAVVVVGAAPAAADTSTEIVLTDFTDGCQHAGVVTDAGEFDPTGSLVSAVAVEVDAYDVDSDHVPPPDVEPERDDVSLNGVLLGQLEGTSETSTTTVFPLSPNQVASVVDDLPAVEVAIDIDVLGVGWCVDVEEVRVTFTTSDDPALCRAGGWEEFGFANQGACVSSLAGPDPANVCADSGAGNGGESLDGRSFCEGIDPAEGAQERHPDDIDPGNSGTHNRSPDVPPGASPSTATTTTPTTAPSATSSTAANPGETRTPAPRGPGENNGRGKGGGKANGRGPR